MAEELGEVRVNIEESGADEAADSIADARGDSSGGSGGGGGAGMLGGISAKLAGILGFVAFLASLKPIQEILTGLQRLFSITLLPLISLLSAFLTPILQKLLRLVGNINFSNIGETIANNIRFILSQLFDEVSSQISSSLGVGNQTANTITREGAGYLTDIATDPVNPLQSIGERTLNIGLDLTTEQSSSSVDEGFTGLTMEQTLNNGTGGQ